MSLDLRSVASLSSFSKSRIEKSIETLKPFAQPANLYKKFRVYSSRPLFSAGGSNIENLSFEDKFLYVYAVPIWKESVSAKYAKEPDDLVVEVYRAYAP